jgi:hypothetical protein
MRRVAEKVRGPTWIREQVNTLDVCSGQHCIDIFEGALWRKVGDIALGQACPALIEPDHPESLTQMIQEGGHDWRVVLLREGLEYEGRPEQCWSSALHAVRNAYAIGRCAVACLALTQALTSPSGPMTISEAR